MKIALFFAMWTMLTFASRRAAAYAWMIRHAGSSQCVTCHVDPSGGHLLNEYGRTEITDALVTKFGTPSSESKRDEFAFGLVPLPEWLNAGGSLRTLGLRTTVDGADATTDFILMQADLRAQVQIKDFRAYGSLGYLGNGNSPATLFASDDLSLVSREHWLGWWFLGEQLLVRAGRVTLPFGVRSIEHTLFVRQATRTDLNDTQQHGVAIAWAGNELRGEIMGIAGNFQERPDAFRERGYSAYLEYTFADRYAIGASSLFTHAKQDVYLRVPVNRQAHGGFFRVAPIELIAILGEVDWVSYAPESVATRSGVASMLQLDLEPIQGLHLIGTGETLGGELGQYAQYAPGAGSSWSVWGGVQWFFFPHFDVRFDYMHRSQRFGDTRVPVDAFMIQGHFFL